MLCDCDVAVSFSGVSDSASDQQDDLAMVRGWACSLDLVHDVLPDHVARWLRLCLHNQSTGFFEGTGDCSSEPCGSLFDLLADHSR